MIVIAIIGILAAIAVPQYQDYIARTQVNRLVGEVSAMKTSVETNLINGDATVATPADAVATIGWGDSNLTTDFNANVVAAGTGTLTATLNGQVSPSVNGATISLTRAATGGWTCLVAKGTAGDGWKDSFIPADCRP
jgi:type IV pilus assembly protein PilA